MKKIISVCLCICLMSGCDKLLNHGRPVNTVVEDKAPHSLPSNTPNASASVPSNTPAPTPEPSKTAQPSDSADTGSSVGKYVGYSVVVILSVIVVCCGGYYGVYKPLYRFADIDIKPFLEDLLDEIPSVKDMPEGCKECYFSEGHFFDFDTNKFIEEIPVSVKEGTSGFVLPTYYYKPNSLMLNLLKTLLRKIFRIEVPKSYYDR
ncbi:hypothetical protein [Candidatus Endomicrobiellum agilis]|uniref:hypothetical protein n=1 Tax=Candidatus Endomicrobiellum agilis TaxID=3238957 RepID=UPI00358B1617|nr:hypothetical protein [Endomicrobium sp.]